MIIDIESSSLSKELGMPIHIAWKSKDLVYHGYINIFKLNHDNFLWDNESEKIHGISKDFLIEYGISPHLMCKRLNESLSSSDCVSDSLFDDLWAENLFKACEVTKQFKLNVANLHEKKNNLNLIGHLAHHDVILIENQNKVLTSSLSM